jgi:hypothetical protein
VRGKSLKAAPKWRSLFYTGISLIAAFALSAIVLIADAHAQQQQSQNQPQASGGKPNIHVIFGDDIGLYGAQAFVAKLLETFKDYPPSQRAATFTIARPGRAREFALARAAKAAGRQERSRLAPRDPVSCQAIAELHKQHRPKHNQHHARDLVDPLQPTFGKLVAHASD